MVFHCVLMKQVNLPSTYSRLLLPLPSLEPFPRGEKILKINFILWLDCFLFFYASRRMEIGNIRALLILINF